ncbi:MAG: HAD family hydrolase [Bacillota bacterium]
MATIEDVKTLFLDYDGTLHDSLNLYAPAFRKAYRALVRHHGAKERTWSDEEISGFMGQTPSEMWASFGPSIGEEAKQEASKLISQEMERGIKNGNAVLYDGALETLETLKNRGYKLVFISNCKNYYMHAHTKQFGLDRYFDAMVCSQTYEGVERKADVLSEIKKDFEGPMAIVGDRHHDMEAGRENALFTIGSTYGFAKKGELDEADYLIDDITELQTLFK